MTGKIITSLTLASPSSSPTSWHSTLDIAPTLLDRFGVTPPAHMRGSVLS